MYQWVAVGGITKRGIRGGRWIGRGVPFAPHFVLPLTGQTCGRPLHFRVRAADNRSQFNESQPVRRMVIILISGT